MAKEYSDSVIIPGFSYSVEHIPVKVTCINKTLFVQGGVGCPAEYEKELRRVLDTIKQCESMVLTQMEFDDSAIQYLRDVARQEQSIENQAMCESEKII